MLTRKFLSFSPDKEVVKSFLNFNFNNHTKTVLFLVNPLNQNKDSRVTNINTKNISFFPDEKEILFLPFSGFEISGYEEKENYTIIHLRV